MMNDLIWLVGGGLLQLPIAREIKRRGYKLFVTDSNSQAACRELADIFNQLSTYDVAAHLDLLSYMHDVPVAVLTDAADVGPTVSALTELLGLPGISYQTALNVRDKSTMRDMLGMTYPVYITVSPEMYLCDAWLLWERVAQRNEIRRYPCVVKATDNCASRGMTFVRSSDDLAEAIHYARQNNKYSKNIIIEECLSGPEFAADWLVIDGQVKFVNGAIRVFDEHKFGLELGHTNPWQAPDEVLSLVQIIAEKLDVTSGPFKTDLLFDKQHGWMILETATRWSGGFDHTHTQKLAHGRNLEKVLLDYALGLPLDESDLIPKWYSYAAAYAPVFDAGQIDGFANIDNALKSPGVSDIIVLNSQRIENIRHCAQRPVFVITQGADANIAWQLAVEAAWKLTPRYK